MLFLSSFFNGFSSLFDAQYDEAPIGETSLTNGKADSASIFAGPTKTATPFNQRLDHEKESTIDLTFNK